MTTLLFYSRESQSIFCFSLSINMNINKLLNTKDYYNTLEVLSWMNKIRKKFILSNKLAIYRRLWMKVIMQKRGMSLFILLYDLLTWSKFIVITPNITNFVNNYCNFRKKAMSCKMLYCVKSVSDRTFKTSPWEAIALPILSEIALAWQQGVLCLTSDYLC